MEFKLFDERSLFNISRCAGIELYKFSWTAEH